MAPTFPDALPQSPIRGSNGCANPANQRGRLDTASKMAIVPSHLDPYNLLRPRGPPSEEPTIASSLVSSEAPEEDSFAFGIEKGFWRVSFRLHSATHSTQS